MADPTSTDLNMDEINNANAGSMEANAQMNALNMDDYTLSAEERDFLGEIGNICMGTSATTLSALLGKKVNITTPKVSIARSVEDLGHYQKPFLAVEVSYTEGVDGYNILMMQESDVKVITDLLMGGEGIAVEDNEMDELHFSAISEVMNQMVGSSSTSLSNIINQPVNITPPKVKKIVMEDDDLSTLIGPDMVIIKISFDMEIVGILQSELMQLLPYKLGKKLASDMMNPPEETPVNTIPEQASKKPQAQAPQTQAPMQPAQAQQAAQAPVQQTMRAPMRQAPMQQVTLQPHVGVQSLQYDNFEDMQYQVVPGSENIGLILDVPLQITVELGQCKRSIKDILVLNMGSVIVLDRLAGEMVDIMVNGKLFARGEVVVIDDNYGVRVTDIIAMPAV